MSKGVAASQKRLSLSGGQSGTGLPPGTAALMALPEPAPLPLWKRLVRKPRSPAGLRRTGGREINNPRACRPHG
jgi:hypothetical protein